MGNIFTKPLFGMKSREPLTDPVEIQRARLTLRDAYEPIFAINAGVLGGMMLAVACLIGSMIGPSIWTQSLSWQTLIQGLIIVATLAAILAYFVWGLPVATKFGEAMSILLLKQQPKYYASQIRLTHNVMRRWSMLLMLFMVSVPVGIPILLGGAGNVRIALPAIGGGLVALGLRSRRGMDPRCRNCGYPNALPPDPSTCTECGRDLTTHDGLMLGLPVRDLRMIVPGAVMLVAGCVWIALT